MELAKTRVSKIQNSEAGLIITIPKEKNKVQLAIFGFLTFYLLLAVVTTIPAIFHDPIMGLIFVSLFGTLGYFAFREVIWLLTGITTLSFNQNTFLVIRKSRLRSKHNKYDSSKIKSFDHRDVSSGTGPLAMLQLLRITNKHKLTFTYGHSTLTLIGDLDVSEIEELASLLNHKISTFSKS